MKKTKSVSPGFREGRGYTQADWDEVEDNPELTEEELKEMRPFREVFPDRCFNRPEARTAQGREPEEGD